MSALNSDKFHNHTLANGLSLVAEPMDFSSSVAYSFYVPGGAAYDPKAIQGCSSVMVEMLGRGAGGLNSKDFSEAFDRLGVSRQRSSGIEIISHSTAMLPEKLEQALELSSKLLQDPSLPENELNTVKELALQELKSLEDEPSSKVMVELSTLFYPMPFGNPQMGTASGVQEVSLGDVKEMFSKVFRPSDVVLGVAGKFDWEKLKAAVEKNFSAWKGTAEPLALANWQAKPKNLHIQKDSNQMQIALAFPSVACDHPDYYTARVANGILSGGMAGRLFIEVREKRGLVYRVSSSHSGAKGRGAIIAYAGTTPKNAKECLEVMMTELSGLSRGVAEDELDRAKADLKSRVVMQSEVSATRATNIAHNWWSLGRVRSLEEVKQAIDQVSTEDVVRHAKEFPAESVSLVTLGPEPLEL